MKLGQRGFTSVELLVVIALATFVAGLFWVQKTDIAARSRDSQRKQDINTLYYYLEGVVYPAQKGYPSTLKVEDLKGLPPETLKDPAGKMVGDKESDYIYEPSGCQGDVCSGFKISSELEKEAAFVKAASH